MDRKQSTRPSFYHLLFVLMYHHLRSVSYFTKRILTSTHNPPWKLFAHQSLPDGFCSSRARLCGSPPFASFCSLSPSAYVPSLPLLSLPFFSHLYSHTLLMLDFPQIDIRICSTNIPNPRSPTRKSWSSRSRYISPSRLLSFA